MLYVEILKVACESSPIQKENVFEALWALKEAKAFMVETVVENGKEKEKVRVQPLPTMPPTFRSNERHKEKYEKFKAEFEKKDDSLVYGAAIFPPYTNYSEVEKVIKAARKIVSEERDPVRLQLMDMVSRSVTVTKNV